MNIPKNSTVLEENILLFVYISSFFTGANPYYIPINNHHDLQPMVDSAANEPFKDIHYPLSVYRRITLEKVQRHTLVGCNIIA